MRHGKKDLFDFLGISVYEHSYTKLLQALFKEHENWAREFFEEVWGYLPAEGRVLIRTQISIPKEGNKNGRDRLDLALVFGDIDPHIWIIEAKIKSGESSDQLQRYEREDAQQYIANEFGLAVLPPQEKWLYSYLTLEKEEPSRTQRFIPIDYKPIHKVLSRDIPELAEEILPAYKCLCERLRDYYDARGEVLSDNHYFDNEPVKEYLSRTRGLIDKINRFHWLTRLIAEENRMLSEAGKTEQGDPFCKMQPNHWRGPNYNERESVVLSECFDIHFELQLIGWKTIKLKLHYESNPYVRKQDMEELPNSEEQIAGFRQSRGKFVQALDIHEHAFKDAGWEYTSLRYSWQLAKVAEDLDAEVNVESLRRWVKERSKAVSLLIDDAGQKALW